MCSALSTRGAPLHAYVPSKAAVVHITACLAAEWSRSGVRVNAVSPDFVGTPLILVNIQSGKPDLRLLVGGGGRRWVDWWSPRKSGEWLLSCCRTRLQRSPVSTCWSTEGKGCNPAAYPMKRMARPEEIAAMAVFLCGAAGGYVSGAIFDIKVGTHFH